MNLTLKDFQPINRWELCLKGGTWSDGEPKYLIDQTTGRPYWNETMSCVRQKCILLALATPLVHLAAAIKYIACRIFKLITAAYFRMSPAEGTSCTFKAQVKEAAKDLIRIFTAPIALIALELSAFYGIYSPYNGRKLYGSLERLQYDDFILAPCFQPNPIMHVFGGDPNARNVF